MGDIFLSYKNEDRRRAAQVVAAFEAHGLSVWWDQHIEPGTHWRETITQRLMAARCVIVLWTKASVGAGGQFVHDEASRATRRGVYLPVRLDPVEPPLGFGQHQSLSLIGWKGDRLAPAFQALLTAAQAMIAGKVPPVAPPVQSRAGLDRRWLIGCGMAGLALAGGAGVFMAPRDLRCAVGLCNGVPGPTAIAVLPFRNLSGDAGQDYLGEGISEELRDALSRLGAIKVMARTSSGAFRNAPNDTAAIAEKMGVSYILDGSVREAGKSLRISAQLIDPKSGFERWSQSYDRQMDDFITLQSGIATSVAESLRGQLPGAVAAAGARSPTPVPAADDAFLRGRQRYLHGGDEKSYREALRLFEAAIAADPGYAEAYAARASVLTTLASQFEPADHARATYDQAIASAGRAVALAPGSAYAQSVLGFTLVQGRLDFAGARDPYEMALKAGPNDARVLVGYGQFAVRTGQTKRGVDALAYAVSLDPLNPETLRAQALVLYAARRYAQSIEAMRKALALSPSVNAAHASIGDALLMLGETKNAVAEYHLEPPGYPALTGLAIALRRLDDPVGARTADQALVKGWGDSAVYQQAEVHAQWGEPDLAFASLARAEAVGDSGLTNLRTDPLLDPIRNDPRFRALLARLKLT